MSVGMATGVSPKASPVSPATAALMAPSATHVIRYDNPNSKKISSQIIFPQNFEKNQTPFSTIPKELQYLHHT